MEIEITEVPVINSYKVTFTKEQFEAIRQLCGKLTGHMVVKELGLTWEQDDIIYAIYSAFNEKVS